MSERFKRELQKSFIFRSPKRSAPPPTLDPDANGGRPVDWLWIARICLIVAFAIVIVSALRMLSAPEANTQQLLRLETGDLDGYVVDDRDGGGIDAARVRFEDTNTSTFTNASGYYRFESIEAGHRVLVVTADGFDTERRNVTIMPALFRDASNRENFTLKNGDGFVATGSFDPALEERVGGILATCAIVFLIIATLLFMALIMTWLRRRYPLALFGAVVGIFAIADYYLPTILCAVAALIIILERRRFR